MEHEAGSAIKQSNQWWRWLLVPFASTAGGAAGAFGLGAVFWLSMKLQGGYSSDGWMYLYILPVFSMGAFGWLFVSSGAWTAPRGKAITAIVMLTTMVLVCILNIAIGWFSMSGGVSQAVRITLSSAAACVMGVMAAIQIHHEER